jgi:hypothetical protein
MKLGKLLAAGKSIMDVRKEVSYRSSRQVYLPKFISEKNPFQHEAARPAANAAPEICVEPQPSLPEPAKPVAVFNSAPVAVATPGPTRLAPPEKPVAAPVKPQPRPAAAAHEKKSGWTHKFNPMAIFKSTPAKAASPFGQNVTDKTHKPATMQTELSLDTVRVVQNDLRDADVEVVPMKSRSAPTEEKPAKKSWEFLGERLFGVEAT